MPFSYYARLSRSQQAIYRKSDEIVEVRLPQPGTNDELDDLATTFNELLDRLQTESRARAG